MARNRRGCRELSYACLAASGSTDRTEQLRELMRLQGENERLRRAVSDLTLDKLILAEVARGNY